MSQGLFGRLQHTLAERTASPGLTAADLLALPSAERRLVNWMTRSGDVTWAEQAQVLLETLRAKGFMQQLDNAEPLRYQVLLAPRRKRKVPTGVWQLLTDKLSKEAGA